MATYKDDDAQAEALGEFFADRRPMMLACCALGLEKHGATPWDREGVASEIYAEAAVLMSLLNEAPYGNCGALCGLAADALGLMILQTLTSASS